MNNTEERLEKMLQELHKGALGREEWLTEDETATYDRIIARRQWGMRLRRWGVAAAMAGVFFLLGMMWSRQHTDEQPRMAQTEKVQTVPQTIKNESKLAQLPEKPHTEAPTAKTATPPTQTKAARKQESKPKATSESTEKELDTQLAHIEKELDQMDEEVYTAHLQRIVAMDEKLQRMVSQILTDANGESTTAENTEEVIYF